MDTVEAGRNRRRVAWPWTAILTLGVSESVLSSWGADVVRRTRDGGSKLDVEIHTHRSPVVVDHVRSGEHIIGLCAGLADSAADLVVRTAAHESMVLIPSGLHPIRLTKGTPIITIEEHAATWSSIERGVREAGFEVSSTVESFSAIARMAMAGLGHGLVPLGVARSAGLPPQQIQHLKRARIRRPISLIGRRSVVARKPIASFFERLEEEVALALA